MEAETMPFETTDRCGNNPDDKVTPNQCRGAVPSNRDSAGDRKANASAFHQWSLSMTELQGASRDNA